MHLRAVLHYFRIGMAGSEAAKRRVCFGLSQSQLGQLRYFIYDGAGVDFAVQFSETDCGQPIFPAGSISSGGPENGKSSVT